MAAVAEDRAAGAEAADHAGNDAEDGNDGEDGDDGANGAVAGTGRGGGGGRRLELVDRRGHGRGFGFSAPKFKRRMEEE